MSQLCVCVCVNGDIERIHMIMMEPLLKRRSLIITKKKRDKNISDQLN